MKKNITNITIFSLPILIIFSLVLLAYWPGILVSDSMVQWHQAQTKAFSDWHPAYNTIYIFLLTRICNHPGFVLLIQCFLLALCTGFVFERIYKYYKVNKIYLFIMSVLFGIIPLNFNFAVTLLKDTLYSAFILLLTGLILDIINCPTFFYDLKRCIALTLTFLLIALFRHNGILVVLLTLLVLLVKYRNKKGIYIVFVSFLIVYLLLTKIGFKLLDVKEGNTANKYGPISHIMARLLNTEGVEFTQEELNTLNKYVDIDLLKNTYDPYNMDYSINAQNIENIKLNSNSYIRLAVRKFTQYPKIVILHYIHLTSFLYSPVPFNGSYTFGMFVETDLWQYKDTYPDLNEHSQIPSLLKFLKNIEFLYQNGNLGNITMRPALYMYLSILFVFILCFIKRNTSLLFILLPFLFNTISLAIAMPVAMTRYVYSTMLVFYMILTWFLYEIFIIIKGKINERKN